MHQKQELFSNQNDSLDNSTLHSFSLIDDFTPQSDVPLKTNAIPSHAKTHANEKVKKRNHPCPNTFPNSRIPSQKPISLKTKWTSVRKKEKKKKEPESTERKKKGWSTQREMKQGCLGAPHRMSGRTATFKKLRAAPY